MLPSACVCPQGFLDQIESELIRRKIYDRDKSN